MHRIGVFVCHGGSKIAALVDVVGGDDEVAHDIAMHIAAAKPKALDQSGIPAELIETERRVAIEKAREAGAVREQGVNPLLSASQKYKRLSYLGTHERECAGTGAGSLSGKRYEYFNYSRNL